MNPVLVVGLGMGPEHFSVAAQEAIETATVLAGGERLVDLFPEHPGPRLILKSDVDAWLEEVAAAAQRATVAVLASGDPLFFGIGPRLIERLGEDRVVIVPNVTTVQAAFARLAIPWTGTAIVSLHGRDADSLFTALVHHDKVAVFTDPQNTPARIAAMILERGLEGWGMVVLENLGQDEEGIFPLTLAEAVETEFAPLNLVVLLRHAWPETLTLGTPDERFEPEAGLITKAEVRAVALARLRLEPHHLLWDLGAGSGAVGLEASRLLFRGRVICVERRAERAGLIRDNRTRFGAANVQVVEGELPAAMDGLPDPDRIFIGGGGEVLPEIIDRAGDRLPPGGLMVVSAVRLEAVEAARRVMAEKRWVPEVAQVQISRGAPLGDGLFMKALNPVWLISGGKP
jgi:precorrin-6Y C5,15-methyltransferase (decarboxylating)